MNSGIIYGLALIGVVTVGVLSTIAFRLHRQVREQQRQRELAQAAYDKKTEERQRFVLHSLEVIAGNVLDEGLNLTEATIRCKILLDSLELPGAERDQYKVLDHVFEQVCKFDTHQARKALAPAERLSQDLRREQVEREFEVRLKACFGQLRKINQATAG